MPIEAASIMTRQIITAKPNNTVAEVANLLTKHDISAVPVCADDGTLLGIISEGDLMRPFKEEHSLRYAWWLGVLLFGDQLAQKMADYIRQDRHRARDLMTSSVITARETATPSEIANLLLCHRVKRVPIVRDAQLVGIISRADLIRTLALLPNAFSHEEWKPSEIGSDHPSAVSDSGHAA